MGFSISSQACSKWGELDNIHPRFSEWCRRNGYAFVHHVHMKGAGFVDFIAWNNTELLVVECKIDISKVYAAISQVQRYVDWIERHEIIWHKPRNIQAIEHSAEIVPCIVIPGHHSDENIERQQIKCNRQGIELLALGAAFEYQIAELHKSSDCGIAPHFRLSRPR